MTIPRSDHVLVLLFGALLSACGGGEPAPAATPPEVVEATPEPTPEAPPEPAALLPATLVHVILEEVVAAPPLPSRSPLARSVGVASATVPSAEYLRWDLARAEVSDAVSALESGYGPSDGTLALVEWRIRWGAEAQAGETRRWGICSLPCVVEDRFVAGPEHHPVLPTTQPRPLFAHRPGAADVEIVSFEGGIDVLHAGTPLWATEAKEPIEASAEVTVPVLMADGVTGAEWTWTASRTLRVVDVRSRTYGLEKPADPPPSTTRILPALEAKPDAPRLVGVQSVPEAWAWAEADRLTGSFKVKPSPADYGLRMERIAKQVLWYPTSRQAGEGKAEFETFVLTQGTTALTVSPFPEGADVLGGTPALGGRMVVAALAGYELDPRVAHIVGALEHFQTVLPLKDPGETTPDPWILYSVAEPTGVVPGSAGPRLFALTVDSAPDEMWSLARAWARLQLAPHVAAASPAALDFITWATAELSPETPDTSVYMATFAEAGDDVLGVWKDWLVDPERKGAPDPLDFLGFVEGQLPQLAERLRRDLLERRFTVQGARERVDFADGEVALEWSTGELAADGAIFAVRLPEGSSHGPVEVTVAPEGPGTVRWSAKLVAERYWDEAVADAGARGFVLEDLPPTKGGPRDLQEAPEIKAPVRAPSQRGAMQQRTAPPLPALEKRKRQGPATATLQHDDQPTGRSTLLVLLWGDAGTSAEVSIQASAPTPVETPQ